MRNKKPGYCCWCGKYIAPGEGNLFYIDEGDEMLGIGPFGVTGWIVSCIDKDKCEQRRKEHEERAKKEREEKERIEKLEAELFPEEREYYIPGKGITVDGTAYEQKGKGWDIYGFGVRYIVASDGIWKLRNNGSDGADWSVNNVRTGGAGAIGYRYEATNERLAFLGQYCENIAEKERREAEKERQRRETEEARIRDGLEKMIARGVTLEMIEKLLAKGKTKTFCPRELTENGRPTVHLTIAEAKRILGIG